MDLTHYETLSDVPEHLTTRAGLKKLGLEKNRPQPTATVTSYGKAVFLYNLREASPLPQSAGQATTSKGRVRVKPT